MLLNFPSLDDAKSIMTFESDIGDELSQVISNLRG
jgi:hypothetical protein